MPIDKTIFGLRFHTNEALQPSQEELRAFMESPKKEGKREFHDTDLAKYRELIKGVYAFEHELPKDATRLDFRRELIYGVLSHTHFVKATLQSAVEHYKFHMRVLQTLDFKKPTAFIKAAEEEMNKLNPKRKDDAAKLAKFQGMIDERNKTLMMLKKRRTAVTDELVNLALYIRNNLVKVDKLCGASIGVLKDVHLGQKQVQQITEDIKTQFKDELRDRLHQGQITKQDLETVKHDVAVLLKEISSILKADVQALMTMYESVQNHARNSAGLIDSLIEKFENKKNKEIDEERDFFLQIEQVLVSLVSNFQFELEPPEIRTETPYKHILLEKRKEMLDKLFELLHEERRSWNDRRSNDNRRTFNDPNYRKPDRRSVRDRRSPRNRRSP